MEKDIGIGVIGVGMGLDLVYLNYEPESRFEVRGLCAAHEEKVRRCGQVCNIPYTTTDYQDLLKRDDLQVIAVFSPDHLHAQHILDSLDAGKHVVVTKPMVTSLEDALKIVKKIDETGLKFLVGETCRFYTSFVAVKRLYDDGDLGEIIFSEAHYVHDLRDIIVKAPWRIEMPQDFMYGGCCHPLDSLVWFCGAVDAVQANGINSGVNHGYPIEDTYLINLKFANGKIARVLGAYGLVEPPMPMMGLNIYGTRGSAIADFHDFQTTHLRVILDKIEARPTMHTEYPPDTKGAYGQGDAVRRYMANFEDCIVNNKQSALNAREGTKTIAALSAAWESIRSGGKPVEVVRDY
jgi:predicted dehydrogenase